jgi:hypothetical protein
MRKIALRTVFGGIAALTLLAGAAAAETWRDPNGRFTFDAPRGWVMEVLDSDPTTVVIAGSANNECYILAIPNAGTSTATPDAMRDRMETAAPEAWVRLANAVSPMFPNNSAQLADQSVDTSNYWPIQRASFTGGERPVIAALTGRPGMDIAAFCWTYAGADATATYEALFRSLAHPSYPQQGGLADLAPAPAPTPTP